MTDHQKNQHGASLPHSVFRADWVREHEKNAANALGISLYELMERAGQAAFTLCRTRYPNARRWLILCGHGNNGGDGYVVARLAQQSGIDVTVIGCGEAKTLPLEAQQARERWVAQQGIVLNEQTQWPTDCDLIVDGLLGTGIHSAPKTPYDALINRMNSYGAPIVALDMPSGLAADSGFVYGPVVNAAATIAFVALKPGLLTGLARNVTGELYYNSLGLSAWLAEQNTSISRLTRADLSQWLTPRRPCSHKGDHGKLLLIGGDIGTGGAICLAGEAALRTGSGLVRVLTRQEHIAPLLAARPELMVHALNPHSLADGIEWADAVAIGPGLGQSDWAEPALQAVLASDKALLWDADALNWLATHPGKHERRIITPHPGEAARLLKCSIAQIEQDRLHAAQLLAQRYGGVVVLKGAGTVIADENGNIAIADVGNAGMATGGMGDVLSGMIASLVGQRLSLFDAACAGCVVHGAAADVVAQRQGERGMMATDLINVIPYCVNP